MKKVFFVIALSVFSGLGYTAMAQEDVIADGKSSDKESQEIIIRKKGDKDASINIQITGDKVTINGKPLIEFKDDEITVNKRNIIVRDGDRFRLRDDLAPLEGLNNFSFDFNDDDAEPGAFLGVTTDKDDKGAKISLVTKETSAAKAGLQKDDIITKVGDKKIDGPESLSEAISAKKPKDDLKVYYLRDGKEKSVKVTLGERKASGGVIAYSSPDGSYKTLRIPQVKTKLYSDQLRANRDQMKAYGEAYDSYNKIPKEFSYNFDMNDAFPRQKKLGLRIQDTEDGSGVKVLEVEENSAALTAGVKKDDVITEVGGVKVTNTDEVREQLQENAEKSSYNIKAKRNGTEMSFDIKIPKKLKTANL